MSRTPTPARCKCYLEIFQSERGAHLTSAVTTMLTLNTFQNPGGSISYRVSGTMPGRLRIRQNFASRSLAEQFMLEKNISLANASIRMVATRLSDVELADAEAALAALKFRAPGTTLVGIVQGYVAKARARKQVSWDDAVRDFRTAFSASHAVVSTKGYMATLKRFGEFSGKRRPDEIREADAEGFARIGDPKSRSIRFRLAVLSSFFGWAKKNGLSGENPVSEYPEAEDLGTPAILSPVAALELMRDVERNRPALMPFYALALFGGVRPSGEIGKLAAEPKGGWEHIDFAAGVIRIEPRISKVGRLRTIPLGTTLRAWLKACEGEPLLPRGFAGAQHALTVAHGVPYDGLRHSFISYRAEQAGSIGRAAMEAGNSESICLKHYLNRVSAADAEAFWAIMPQGKSAVAH